MTNSEKFSITDSAAKRVAYLMSQEEKSSEVFLRIEVQGGGCSGFQYHYDFDTKRNDDDFFIEKNGARVAVDATSLPFIEGSALDFVETLGSAAFEIKNPNATANCGCGNSFSV